MICPSCHRETTPAPRVRDDRGYFGEARFCTLETGIFSRCEADLVSLGAMPPPPKVAKNPHAYRGVALEAMLKAGCKLYAAEGRARVQKIRTPLARTHDGRVLYAKTGKPDFEGAVLGGRSCAFEAKSTRGSYLGLSEIREVQRRALTQLAELGGLAGLVVQLDAGTAEVAEWWVPWRRVLAFEALHERRSLTREWLDANGVLLARKRNAALWLDGALEADRKG